MIKRRVRTWNSDLAYRLSSQIKDRSEQRLFRRLLAQNELNEFGLRVVAAKWRKEKIGDESLCSFLIRVGWLAPSKGVSHQQPASSCCDVGAMSCRLSQAAYLEIQNGAKDFWFRTFFPWLGRTAPSKKTLKSDPYATIVDMDGLILTLRSTCETL